MPVPDPAAADTDTVEPPGEPGTSPRGEAPTAHDVGGIRRRGIDAIGHELRTHLALVTGPIELLDELALSDDARRQVTAATRNVARLTVDLRRLTEVVSWPVEPRLVEVDLGELLHRLVAVVDVDTPRIDLRAEIAAPTTVTAEPDMLRWTFEVLIAEVAEVVDDGTRLVVTVDATDAGPVVTVGADGQHGSQHALEATDVGRSTPAADGHVAREVVAWLGGRVLTGAPESGMMLRVEFRDVLDDETWRAEDDRAAPSLEEHANATSGPAGWDTGALDASDRLLALVVEDDEDMRAFLERSLTTEYRVVTVATAEDALTMTRQMHPDLIVCDVVLPHASGEQLASQLHGEPELADIPFIVLTGRTDHDLRVRMLRDGADDYVTKPFVVEELRARMANLLAMRLDVDDLRDKTAQAERTADQLRGALDSRVVIEQAKAFVAAERRIGVQEAFEVLRSYARTNNLRLHEVARRVVERSQP